MEEYEPEKQQRFAAAPVPPHIVFTGLGFLARKIADDIEKAEDVPTRVAHLKYRMDKIREKQQAITEEYYAYEDALDYLYTKDPCLRDVEAKRPHVFKELADWADEFAEFLKIKPLFSCW